MSLIACGSKVDNFDDGALQVLQKNILGFQIAVYQARFVQEGQAIQELLGENPDQRGTKTPELVLLDQFVQIDAEKFKDQAQVLPVYKGILQSQEVVVVILIKLSVQLVAVSIMYSERRNQG